ncbi:hypothetical protein FOMPIDRAFT_60893 [Fomitopsis schrenkii]|uniref:Uncharacterized protein n=1 Tax=Fomitopsis schrenkii TaxID=2126942 RepID=S8DII7_FOMSC|nr:hypothetical protein FOMPIDRAFT_60893 [Fomitopsis schrenkii]
MADVEYSHDDFEVVRTDPRFGGFEVLKHKDGSTVRRTQTRNWLLKSHVFKDGQSGAAHPIYTHEGRKWILLSLPEEHYRNSEQTQKLLGKDKHSSREAVGLWQVGSSGWKVYAKTTQLSKIDKDYTRAQVDAHLPVGKPAPAFRQGLVKQGTKPATEGFVLIAQWMDGTNFQKTAASFKSALTREEVPKVKTSDVYRKISHGCDAAKAIGLQDCQGFVKPGNTTQPIRFIDIHTSWNDRTGKYGSSTLADQLVEEIDAWAK